MKEESKCPFYDKYRIESQIGRGASGTCYRVQHSLSKQIFAMKKIHISSIKKLSTRQACSQVAILSKISHPNIIKLTQSFNDQSYLYIVMQYAPKGDLHNILKRRKIKKDVYSESQIWEMARQLLSALQYLHSHKIIHRDVKTLNIFVDSSGKLYLGDLGVSKILKNDGGLYSRVGTPLYLAPQIIKYQKYDYKADIWGLGCVCYQLAAMSHPFEGRNIISLGQNIVNSQPKLIENYSQELNNLIMQMLQKNPTKRLGAKDLLKKYFKENRLSTQPTLNASKKNINQQQKRPQTKSNNFIQKNEIKQKQRVNDKNPHFLKSNQIRRKILNNFLQQKLMFHQNDKINEQQIGNGHIFKESSKKQIKYQERNKQKEKEAQRQRNIQSNQKSFQDTVVFSRKVKSKENSKKLIQATHKTYISINSPQYKSKNHNHFNHYIKDHYAPFSNKEKQHPPQAKSIQVYSSQNSQIKSQNLIPSLSSQKKMPAFSQNIVSSKSSKKGFFAPSHSTVERREETNKTQVSYADVNRLSSENQIGSPPVRVGRMRPKSGIMTKQRHQSTMKNIKKSIRRLQLQSSDNMVQTKLLKKPQMIIL